MLSCDLWCTIVHVFYLSNETRDNATIIVYSSDDIVGKATRGTTSSINFLVASREMKASYERKRKRKREKKGITFHRGKGASFPRMLYFPSFIFSTFIPEKYFVILWSLSSILSCSLIIVFYISDLISNGC